MSMVFALWLFGVLAIASFGLLMSGLLLTKNGEYVKSAEPETIGRAMFLASLICVISLVIWVILAVIYWWNNWGMIALIALLLYVGYVVWSNKGLVKQTQTHRQEDQ